MDYSAWQSLPAMFFQQAEKMADRNFLWAKREGAYRPLTWGETARAVKDLSRGLRALGLEPGERVVLLSENRPEWLIADLAIMAAGAISVPAYTTNTSADHNHLLTDSGARGTIVSTRALAGRLLPAAIEAPDCKWLICIEDLDSGQQGPIETHGWDRVLDAGAARPDDVAEIVARAKRSDTSCLIYTSGTGGVPKGVMLSHGAILCNCMGAYHLLEQIGLGDDVFLSFLPLSHAYEHTAGQFFPISIGAEIYYAAGIEKLLANMAEARPTIMTAVPRLYESMYQRILRGVEKQGGVKKTLFELALRLGRKRYFEPRGLGLWERLQDLVVERLVRDKVRARFGGRLKAMVSGGAALNPDIGVFFVALGLRVLQGYGQTEVADAVNNECLFCGGDGGGFLVVVPNEPVGRETHAFPAQVEHDEVVAENQRGHGKEEHTDPCKEPRVSLADVDFHVLGGVQRDQCSQTGHKQHPQQRQRIDIQREVGDELHRSTVAVPADVQPIEHVDDDGTVVTEKERQRDKERSAQQAHRDPTRRLGLDLHCRTEAAEHRRECWEPKDERCPSKLTGHMRNRHVNSRLRRGDDGKDGCSHRRNHDSGDSFNSDHTSALSVSRRRYNNTTSASASAASAAATVRMNITNTCPDAFKWNRPKAIIAIAAPWNISSVQRNMTIMLRRVTNPISPITNSNALVKM